MLIFYISVILSGKLTKFCVIPREIDKVTGIGHECDFTIKNSNETRFCEMLKIDFKREFSMNLNSLTQC